MKNESGKHNKNVSILMIWKQTHYQPEYIEDTLSLKVQTCSSTEYTSVPTFSRNTITWNTEDSFHQAAQAKCKQKG